MTSALFERASKSRYANVIAFVLNFLATVQVVWFYLSRVECHLSLAAYERGRERTPFQYRLLLMGPLRWAHNSAAVNSAAAWLTSQRGFFPNGVRPEGLVQALIDLACIATAGLVARRLYQRSSRTGMLTCYVYPLSILMVMSTYMLLTMHSYRFIYDLPALAFFSVGLYLIYTQAHPLWFAAVFVVGTLNRETTLLLLAFFLLARCGRPGRFDWRESYTRANLAVVAPLLAFWLAWHAWVRHIFAANASAGEPRIGLNLALLVIPFCWPQLLGTFAYLLPLILIYRDRIRDATLRAWLWALPIWFAFMLFYGVIIETRIFGELIAYLACMAALVAEETMLDFTHDKKTPPSRATQRSSVSHGAP
jgi:hypothetical protein